MPSRSWYVSKLSPPFDVSNREALCVNGLGLTDFSIGPLQHVGIQRNNYTGWLDAAYIAFFLGALHG